MGVEYGERLRLRARELGLSDSEVARRLGLSQSRYAHYVSGVREPDYATFARICRVLAFSPNDALGFAEVPEQPTEIQRLRERIQATLEVLGLPTLRTANAVLGVLASRPADRSIDDARVDTGCPDLGEKSLR